MPRHWDKSLDGQWEGLRSGTQIASWSNKRGFRINYPDQEGRDCWRNCGTTRLIDLDLPELAKCSGLKLVRFQVEVKAFNKPYEIAHALGQGKGIEKVKSLHCLKYSGDTPTNLFQLISHARTLVKNRRGFWIEVRIYGNGQPVLNQWMPRRCYLTRGDELALLLALYGPLSIDAMARGLSCSIPSVAGALGTLIQRKVARRQDRLVIPIMDRLQIASYISRSGRHPLPKWVKVLLESPEISRSRIFDPR